MWILYFGFCLGLILLKLTGYISLSWGLLSVIFFPFIVSYILLIAFIIFLVVGDNSR